MKFKAYWWLLFLTVFSVVSCKKDSQQQGQKQPAQTAFDNALLSFSIAGELLAPDIDYTRNTILVPVPNASDKHSLTVNYAIASQANATMNNTAVSSGSTFDFSAPVSLTITSSDKTKTATFKVVVQTELEYDGLVGTVVAQKSLNKTYDYYFDQWDGSVDQSLNCVPAVMSMAMKWADSTSAKTPSLIRTEADPQNIGGGFATSQIQSYLSGHGVDIVTDTLDDFDTLLKKTIDNNELMVLAVDMHFIPYNDVDHEHIQKFYQTIEAVWLHCVLVKGYKQIGQTLYAEVYDPYSHGETYATGQIKGIDRYYTSLNLKYAAIANWPYAIIIPPKGKQVVASAKLKTNGSSNRRIPSVIISH